MATFNAVLRQYELYGTGQVLNFGWGESTLTAVSASTSNLEILSLIQTTGQLWPKADPKP